ANGYVRLIGGMVRHSHLMVVIALVIVAAAFYGMTRIPTGFLPTEDQGYLLVSAQLPDGASLERTRQVMADISARAEKVDGVAHVTAISGVSALDNSSSLANAGVAYVVLKDWSVRGPKLALRPIYAKLMAALAPINAARVAVFPPPPIQGIGNTGGFSMQIELKDGTFDLGKLQTIANQMISHARSQSSFRNVSTSFRATVPQLTIDVDRVKAETLHVSVDQVFDTLSTYLGSNYVGQFNKFGHVFQVYAQADSRFRLLPVNVANLPVRTASGTMIPLGTIVHLTPSVGPALLSLYNLYPTAGINGVPAIGVSSGESMKLMDEIAAKTLPPGAGYEWTAMSYQEKIAGTQIYYAFGLALLLVYLVLAGQYESWYAPISVILAVPLSLLGPVATFNLIGLDNNLYVQIGLVLLIALSAKNAILIVEFARDLRRDGHSVIEAATGAARERFRPILMTSFAFILGVAPLVFAQGAGAAARKSIGITVFTGMIASTCLAVLFVPAFFVVIQSFEEWRRSKKRPAATAAQPAE
ncbi:MAG TPA: efflux RND transporter permease subunit, partial [Methylovirgula sp.]|nr:efflux RND transporter permease subunit [Methylovirgula sp.]